MIPSFTHPINKFTSFILAVFIDESDNGNEIVRNGILVPVNVDTRAWRLGRVILAGPNVKYAKTDDVICFPNNMGVPISNIEVDNHGTINKGIFINEQRIFGIRCNDLSLFLIIQGFSLT